VVLPDCLGPVTTTAGKVRIAFLIVFSSVLGIIAHIIQGLISNIQY